MRAVLTVPCLSSSPSIAIGAREVALKCIGVFCPVFRASGAPAPGEGSGLRARFRFREPVPISRRAFVSRGKPSALGLLQRHTPRFPEILLHRPAERQICSRLSGYSDRNWPQVRTALARAGPRAANRRSLRRLARWSRATRFFLGFRARGA